MTQHGGEERIDYVTPVGTATLRRVLEDDLAGYVDSGLDLQHPIRRPEDYDIWEYVVEHMQDMPEVRDWIFDEGAALS